MMFIKVSLAIGICLLSLSVASVAQERTSITPAIEANIPHQVLPLVHAPEVQTELELNEKQIDELEDYFRKNDGTWFRARNLQADKNDQEMSRLETEFWNWAKQNWEPNQIQRLEQLELQAQATRMFLRPDVSKKLRITSSQTSQLSDLSKASDSVQKKLQSARLKGEDTSELEMQLQNALEAEQKGPAALLTAEQKKDFVQLVGPIFNTQALKRIYPMAPDFAAGAEWLNSSALSLAELKGKVVIVHFYAFQCHNCHANFEIYRRWFEHYRNQDVVVIGIQSPETQLERDSQAVKKAAQEKKLQFPIVIDTEMKNWNNWSNTMWPTVYVIDKRGYIRHWWQGELNWQGATGDKVIENVVEAALKE
jgi:peroxiredoxin